jgi:hypothetical protein
MPAKTRTQPIDASAAFGKQGSERIEALRKDVLGRLSAVIATATDAAQDTFGFDVMKGSDDVTDVTEAEALAVLRPSEGDYPNLRGVKHPAIMLGMCANEEGVGMIFRIGGALEWRLFIKALYQHRELLSEYIEEFDELYLLNSDGEEEAIEELDQLFAVDVDSPEFKKSGCTLYFPSLEYPVETEDDFETFTGDFAALFPFYWALLKAGRGEPVDMDHLLNG